MKDYYATLAGADENVGKVLETLSRWQARRNPGDAHRRQRFFLGEWNRMDSASCTRCRSGADVVRYPKLIKAGSTRTGWC